MQTNKRLVSFKTRMDNFFVSFYSLGFVWGQPEIGFDVRGFT